MRMHVAQAAGDSFSDATNLGAPINSPADDGDIFVATHESYLIVTSNRAGGLGRADLHISFRDAEGNWSKLRHLGAPISSAAFDYCPAVLPDERYFFFTRDGDVYWLEASVLMEHRPAVK